MSVERTCPGCGAVLQSIEPNKPGYLPEEKWEKEDAVCLRCFKLKHYQEAVQVEMTGEDFYRILQSIGQREALILHLVDITDFHGTLLSGLNRILGHDRILIVVNKIDLLPQSVRLTRIKQWIRTQTREWGLRFLDIVMISGLKGVNLPELVEKIEGLREGKDVYVVGTTNVGKSTFINRLLKEYGEERSYLEITTSRIPGTTLGLIEIPLDENSSLYDTPGIIQPHQITHMLPLKDLKQVIPAKRINPRVYQLKPGQTIFIGGLARFDFVSGEPQSFTLYLSNEIPVHRTKLERAEELYEKQKGKLLSPPDEEGLKMLPPMTVHSFRLTEGRREDIAIAGLGWVASVGKRGSVNIHVPKGVSVYLRKRMI